MFLCAGCGCDCPATVYCEDCAKIIKCPHGNPLGECHPCDVAGDLAYDSARESAAQVRRCKPCVKPT